MGEIKERIDLVDYIGRFVDLERQGAEWKGKCPFHDDATPSLSVNPEKGLWHCFGCEAGGDVIEFCKQYHGDTLERAVDRLREEYSTETAKKVLEKPSPCGITVQQLAAAKGFSEKELKEYGVTDDSYMGKPAVRFSYMDASGSETWHRYRINLTRDRFRNPKGHEVTAYGFPWLAVGRDCGELILVEGETDAITCWMHGLPCIGIPGASNAGCLSEMVLDGIDRIYIAKEPDSGGETFVKGVVKVLRQAPWDGQLYAMHLRPDAKDLNEVYLRDPDGFENQVDNLKQDAQPVCDRRRQDHAARVTARQLLSMEFAPPKWVIPQLIPTGLTVLAGKPKAGKSWLCMDIGTAIALGDVVLGDIHVPQGKVLYLALEDNLRRLRERLTRVLEGQPSNENLIISTSWKRLDEGGLDDLEHCIDEEGFDLIMIDTLARIRSAQHSQSYHYDGDYQSLIPLQELAIDREKAIILVHHLRKKDSDDPFELVSGTTGITGCADTN